MNEVKIIGFFHLLGYIIKNTYGIFTSLIPVEQFPYREQIDKGYLALFFILFTSRILFQGECLISYIVKKRTNPEYKMGDEPNHIQDMIIFFPNKQQYEMFEWFMWPCYALSLFLVATRLCIEPLITVTSISVVYLSSLILFIDKEPPSNETANT